MCDTFIALGNAAVDGSIVNGKNSNKESNKALELLIYPLEMYEHGGNCGFSNETYSHN